MQVSDEWQSCETCRFWVNRYCKRYAPSPMLMQLITEPRPEVIWPTTYQGEWCGEYERGAGK